MERAADLTPVDTGVNVTVIVQVEPAAKLEPQVFVRPKSSACAPVIAIALMETLMLPVFFMVTV